jgi:hypothetical protein
MMAERTGTTLFGSAWSDLWSAIAALSPAAFSAPSGCRGWLVRDLVCHLVIDAQDALITLATPAGTQAGTSADAEPARPVDSAGYWSIVDAPSGDDPLDALIPRLAAAYEDPALLTFHLEDLGSAAARAVRDADPDRLVETQGMVLRAADFAGAYVLEWTLHHLDLQAGAPDLPGPSDDSLAWSLGLLAEIIDRENPDDPSTAAPGTGTGAGAEAASDAFGASAPKAVPDPAGMLRSLTGRRVASSDELANLPARVARGLPYPIG